MVSTMLFGLKSFHCSYLSIKGSYENPFEQSPSILTSGLSRQGAICCTLPCPPFVPDTEDLVWAPQEIFPSRVSSAPIHFVNFFFLCKNSSPNQIGAWLFRVIQVKNPTSCSPLQFLLPKPGAQGEMRRGREQHHCISYATFTQMARRNL